MEDIPATYVDQASMGRLMTACVEDVVAAVKGQNGTIYNNFTRSWVECGNATNSNNTAWDLQQPSDGVRVEHVVSVVVAICFGIIGLAGLFGNSLVVLGKCVLLLGTITHNHKAMSAMLTNPWPFIHPFQSSP